MPYPPYGDIVWAHLMNKLDGNEVGVAAVMGNLNAESSIIPYRVEGDNTPPYLLSQEFTQAVDDGDYDRTGFVLANPTGAGTGYGLAGWDGVRKGRLYDVAQEQGASVGSIGVALTLLDLELAGYPWLKTTKKLKKATIDFMVQFEAPFDQSEAAKNARYRLAYNLYKAFTGKVPPRESGGLWMYMRRRDLLMKGR